ncbi:MAG TPA: glutaminase [Flavobacteriaceae bacterium]|nr:glutaminase [Flavobacteriaceae bacterium]HEX5743776.1 glutaminase [Flavobacteriaceae bacterium]
MDYQKLLENIYYQVKDQDNKGELATYIPELARINPDKFGISLQFIDGQTFNVGDAQEKFSIQSIAKVFAFSLAISLVGKDIFKRVGVEPSGNSFNSLIQLEYEKGIPRNPFINAGAIVVADILISNLKNPKEELLLFIEKAAGKKIEYNYQVAQSEKSTGFRNAALANMLKSYGNLQNDVDQVLDIYFHLCSISMTCQELASSFKYLINGGQLISTNEQLLTLSQTKRLNALMQTCGFYDEAGEFTYKVGLPGKSGVGGGIIALYPGKFTIAVWSPKLNVKGNSLKGMKVLEQFTTDSQLSIF